MLFGEESLSLRNVSLLIREFNNKARSDSAIIEGFAGVLLPKLPFLGVYCCSKFAKNIWELFDKKEHKIFSLPKDGHSPMSVLVKTALVDNKGEVCSYPEFASCMKVSHTVHPVARLAAWVRMVWTTMFKVSNNDDRLQHLLASLARLQVVDQAKFPYIIGEGTQQDLTSCEVFSKSGDFADLLWLVDAISHGNAINWESVKEVWEKHHISSVKEFSRLLSVCPDPGACLDCVQPKNLCTLIEGEDGTSIAEACVQYCFKVHDENNPHSVYYTAAWNLFKNSPTQLEKFRVNKLKTLLWASQFAFSLMRVKENPVLVTNQLQQTLFDLSNNLTDETAILLWCHLFAGLIVVGDNGISNATALMLSRKVSPIPPEWPEIIKLLAQVEDKTATYIQLEKLYDSGYFSPPPVASSSSAPAPSNKNNIIIPDARFATQLLTLNNRTLSPRWQVAILTSDESVKYTSKLEEGMGMMMNSQQIRLHGLLGDSLRATFSS